MAIEIPVLLVTMQAASDLSAKQYCFVKGTATDLTCDVCGVSASNIAVGVLQDTPKSGEGGNVMMQGISKVVLGATLAAGAQVASDANGKAVAATTGDHAVGVLVMGGASGNIGSVLLKSEKI